MEPENSLPCSKEPSNSPHPEPDQSSPYHPHRISVRSISVLFSHLRLGLHSDFFPSGFLTNTLYASRFSPIRATCSANLILLDLITIIILGVYSKIGTVREIWKKRGKLNHNFLIAEISKIKCSGIIFSIISTQFLPLPCM
jgi:hypothetical protein